MNIEDAKNRTANMIHLLKQEPMGMPLATQYEVDMLQTLLDYIKILEEKIND